MWANNTLEFGKNCPRAALFIQTVSLAASTGAASVANSGRIMRERETRKDGGRCLRPNIFVDFMHKSEASNSFPNIANTVV